MDRLVERITENQLRRACENVAFELKNIIETETEGTGTLADSIQVQRGTQRGKPIIRILAAPYARAFFQGTKRGYAGIPPSSESAGRFKFWAGRHNFHPKRLGFIIGKGRSTGKVNLDRTNILVRAMRAGFRNLRS